MGVLMGEEDRGEEKNTLTWNLVASVINHL